MGLDMYLHKKFYIWTKDGENLKIEGAGIKIKEDKVKYIVEEAGYWRKANQIHKWFVENVQDGNDDCGTYYVSEEKLKELLETVDKVLASIESEVVDGEVVNGYTFDDKGNKIAIKQPGKVIKDYSVAQRLLPPQSGFFFGGTDFDEYYIEDLKHTKAIIEECLKDTRDSSYEYHSSW